jgi:predicted ATP-dependent protease
VIIPHKNKKDLSEIPEEIQSGLEIIPVQTIEKVLEIALERMPIAVIDPEPEVEENMKVDSPEAAILPQTDPPESPRTYDA